MHVRERGPRRQARRDALPTSATRSIGSRFAPLRLTVRLRLTLSYAGFLAVAVAALIAIVFYVLGFMPDEVMLSRDGGRFLAPREHFYKALLPVSGWVLLFIAAVGLGGGWILAGRMLRPLRKINEVARSVASGSLERRVHLEGPNDKFRELADTFDAMLERLQRSFEEQQRFAANASHELRTPHAVTKALIEVALADPDGQDVRTLLRRLDETNERGTSIVEALLALSALDGRTIERNPVDIVEVVSGVLTELRPFASAAGVMVESELEEGDIDGNEILIRQLISNLVVNAIRYNLPANGALFVRTSTRADTGVEVCVVNTGPVVAPEQVDTLVEPFVRGTVRIAGTRGRRPEGSGLGLAIVARIVEAHDGELRLMARAEGSLDVRVRFPAP